MRLIPLLFLLFSLNSFSMEVILTVDDFPFIWGKISASKRLKKVEAVLKKHKVSGVIFFVNKDIKKEDRVVLSNHFIANHGKEHLNATEVNSKDYLKSIAHNHSINSKFDNYLHIFRPPYLSLGSGLKKREIIEELAEEGYKSGHVNVDTLDWFWNAELDLSHMSIAAPIFVRGVITDIEKRWNESKEPVVVMLHDRDFIVFYLDYLLRELKRKDIRVVSGPKEFKSFSLSDLDPIHKYSSSYKFENSKKLAKKEIEKIKISMGESWKYRLKETFSWIFLKL